MPPSLEPIALVLVGFLAGTLGGLVGLGGSIVMVPALTLLFHRDQQLAQASAMIVNVFIAVPATLRHRAAGAIDRRIILRMLPAGLLCMLIGVEVSNRLPSELLHRVFGGFLVYAIVMKLLPIRGHPETRRQREGWGILTFVGGLMGGVAGLTGTGGGPIAVPLLHRLCHIPLRHCIATSATVMCATSTIGAFRKNWALASLVDAHGAPLGLSVADSLRLAALIAPTAVVGAIYGAGLTHRVPVVWLKIAFATVVGAAAVKMLGIV